MSIRKRKPAAPPPEPEIPAPPEPPERLSAEEQTIWRELIQDLCATKVVGPENLPLVERYVVAIAGWRHATAELRREGTVTVAKKSGVQRISVWLSVQRNLSVEISRLERALGIAPSGRAEAGRATDPLGALNEPQPLFQTVGPGDFEPWEPPAR